MELKLQTLSPVHIGTGNALEPFEYIIDDGIYYRIDQKKAFKLALQRHSDFPENFNDWLESTSKKINDLERSKNKYQDKNKRLSELRANFNLKYFCDKVLNDTELTEEILKEGYKYKCTVPNGLQNKKQVDEITKDPMGNVYIPGSSIKGSLRTVLAWNAFRKLPDDEKQTLMQKVISSREFERKNGRFIGGEIDSKLFYCGYKNPRRGSSDLYNDMRYDILKFIKISDAYPESSVKLQVQPANLYLLDKAPQRQVNAQEVVSFNSKFLFELKINADEIYRVLEYSKTNDDKWINFEEKFNRVFGIELSKLDKDSLENEIANQIDNILVDFASTIFKSEGNWIARFQKQIVDNNNRKSENADISKVKKFYDVYDEGLPLLRLGWGSGFLTTTLFQILYSDELTKPYVEKIINRFEIGVPSNRKGKRGSPPKLQRFPKSKRFVAESLKKPTYPMGWAAVLPKNEVLEFE